IRAVDPELPTSRISAGFFKPLAGRLTSNALLSLLTETPRRDIQFNVLWQSWLDANPFMRVIPPAIPPNIAALCDMDLSPGKVTAPRRDFAGSIFMVSRNLAYIIEVGKQAQDRSTDDADRADFRGLKRAFQSVAFAKNWPSLLIFSLLQEFTGSSFF